MFSPSIFFHFHSFLWGPLCVFLQYAVPPLIELVCIKEKIAEVMGFLSKYLLLLLSFV